MTGTEHPTPELPGPDGDQAVVLDHVRHGDVVFLAWLDNWIDKSIRDGTLTSEKASAYREAIAARCAQLGDVPNIVGAVQRLDIKPGDTLVFIAPTDNVSIVHRMHGQVSAHLEGTGVRAIVVPPGTEIKVVHPGPRTYEYPVIGLPTGSPQPDLRIKTFHTVKGFICQVTHLPTGFVASGPTRIEALRALDEIFPDRTPQALETLLDAERQVRPFPPIRPFPPGESAVQPEPNARTLTENDLLPGEFMRES